MTDLGVAVVTGASRGIGAAVAGDLAARGYAVAVTGRDETALAAVRDAIVAAGGRAVAVTADLTRWEDVEHLRDTVGERFGDVDLLVANAGGNPVRPGPVEDISPDEWTTVVDVNLTATFLTVKAFLPGMKQRGRGAIVTVSSAAVTRPTVHSPVPYTAAKSGIEALTKLIAVQAGPFGVRANCVCPETIMTDRNHEQIPAEVQESLREQHPLRRLGEPSDVANAVAFLASPDSAWITGVVLEVSGGATLR